MAGSLVLRNRTEVVPIRTLGRAAQYVRMSTDHQRYSTQNQAAAIATYATQHDLTIVRTYADEGRSGLRISNRDGLVELINDVRFGRADFDHILVYDISRWGRFQDIDESAHYEFICRQAGVTVSYCAEEFDNDGSIISSIIKNIKRVMAAEFSRELSVKVHAGACRVASLGFKQGGTVGYGLRRELVDEHRCSKGTLEKGQRKHLQTDRVLLRLGPQNEQEVVIRIFRQFVVHRKSQAAIARQLNTEQVPNHLAKPWTDSMVHFVLKNENYIGNNVYNKKSFKLKQVMRDNPPELWIRTTGLFEPVVDKSIFDKAQKIMKEQYRWFTDDQLLYRLRAVWKQKGRLNTAILEGIDGVPAPSLYAHRFGSLREAFRRVGYTNTERNFAYLDSRQRLAAKLLEHSSIIATGIRALGAAAVFDVSTDVMTVDGRFPISLRMARYYTAPHHAPVWNVHRRAREPAGLILALRLDKKNVEVTDYFLLPIHELKKHHMSLTETNRSRFTVYRRDNVKDVVRSIMEAVASATHASPAKSEQPKTAPGPSQSKTTNGCARRSASASRGRRR
jgi:DNA invertase Pin-like site-specific DNA recombinase